MANVAALINLYLCPAVGARLDARLMHHLYGRYSLFLNRVTRLNLPRSHLRQVLLCIA